MKNKKLIKSLNVDNSISLADLRKLLKETINEENWYFMDDKYKIPVKRESKYTCQEILDKATNQVFIKTTIKTTETEIFKDNVLVKRLDLDLA